MLSMELSPTQKRPPQTPPPSKKAVTVPPAPNKHCPKEPIEDPRIRRLRLSDENPHQNITTSLKEEGTSRNPGHATRKRTIASLDLDNKDPINDEDPEIATIFSPPLLDSRLTERVSLLMNNEQ